MDRRVRNESSSHTTGRTSPAGLNARRYGAMPQSLRRDHAGTSAFFYLNVSFPETLRRLDFTPDQMREWYQERDLLLPDGCETVIGEDSPLDASVRRVLRQV
ncbi:hypothetical protein [Microbispora sp. NBRC 16548]|uniref:hypothetical protein n=1 Tax=Microbispora sp. NBRC 16548 TaxID=3030994 RepID=UPI0025545C7E|nr:hypothetical protein [Microbispora sp. NBRC 16548]